MSATVVAPDPNKNVYGFGDTILETDTGYRFGKPKADLWPSVKELMEKEAAVLRASKRFIQTRLELLDSLRTEELEKYRMNNPRIPPADFDPDDGAGGDDN